MASSAALSYGEGKVLRTLAQVIRQAFQDWSKDRPNLIAVCLLGCMAASTILFAPPALFGLYEVCRRFLDGAPVNMTVLMTAGQRHFVKSWLWTSANLLIATIVLINISFYEKAPWGWTLQWLFLGLWLLWLVAQFYALPYFIEFDNDGGLWRAWRNGLLTVLASPVQTTYFIVTVLIIVGLSVILVLPLFTLTPCLIIFLSIRAMQNRLQAFGLRPPR